MKISRRIFALCLVLVLGLGFMAGCSKKNEETNKNQGKTPEDIATAIVTDLSTGEYTKAMDDFSYNQEMKKAMSPKVYEDLWTQLTGQFGSFVKINGLKVEESEGFLMVRVQCIFEKGNTDIQVTFDESNAITGLFIKPYSGETVALVPPDSVKEKSITFGEDAFLLSGTFTTPMVGESFPCVILVHGSGPNDRDETIGANAPFRDIAWDLAKGGIATIRYDKRTKTYGSQIGDKITPKEETIEDARYALSLAQTLPEVNASEIYILGHSLGGYLMPKIAEITPEAKGYIIMGGSTSPLEDLMARQYEYLAGLDGIKSNEEVEKTKDFKTAWNKIKQLTPESNYSPSELMGVPKEYWLYLKNYAPAEEMKGVEKPVLILQGEGDYQVDMAEYKGWKDALSENTNVVFKSYPGLNHLFIMGNGSKSPEEYEIPGKVSQEVIEDIENFIKGNIDETLPEV